MGLDTTPPVVIPSVGDITEIGPNDPPVSLTASADDSCSAVTLSIVDVRCANATSVRRGARGDDDDDGGCNDVYFEVEGGTITFYRTDEPGAVVSWTVYAEDECGNSVAEECSITVLRRSPGPGSSSGGSHGSGGSRGGSHGRD